MAHATDEQSKTEGILLGRRGQEWLDARGELLGGIHTTGYQTGYGTSSVKSVEVVNRDL